MEHFKSTHTYDESMFEWNPTYVFESLFYGAVLHKSNSSLYIPRLKDMHGYYVLAKRQYNYDDKMWHIYTMAFDETNLYRGNNSKYGYDADELQKRVLSACIIALHNK